MRRQYATKQNWILDNIRVTKSGCWEWQLRRTRYGYGKLKVEGKHWAAHRYAWAHFKGEIPTGMHVCHHCDNAPCCNPDHLFLGTPKDNKQDSVKKGRDCHGVRHQWSILDNEKIAEIYSLRSKGLSFRQIATRTGMSKHGVWAVLNGRTWKRTLFELKGDGITPATSSPRAKISKGEVSRIFELRSNGFSQSEIGREIGLSQTQIGRILRGVRWRAASEQFRKEAA